MVLTDQELRNALLPGPFNDFLKDCAVHPITTVSGVFSGERRKRGGDLEFYAEIFGTCIFGLSNKKTELDERYDKISADFEEYQDRAAEFLALLTFLKNVIKWGGRTRWSNIVDMFTLLHVSWGLRQELGNADSVQTEQIRDLLDLFQRAVSAKKRKGENGASVGLLASLSAMLNMAPEEVDAAIEGYMSGIRNSSDLGSRRIRSQQLRVLISKQLEG